MSEGHHDTFVSYSHTDRDFAAALRTALAERDIDAWLDESDIPSGSRWREELERAIEVSDAFVFLLSPDSAASQQCARELEHAVRLNKRVLPVRVRETPDAAVPAALATYQFIPSRGVFDVAHDLAVAALIEAIETDRDWVREHTEWGIKASEWDRRGRDASYLLSGTELELAEGWRSGAAGKQPGVSTLQSEYLDASRQGATRRLRRTRGFVSGALVVASALAVLALIQRQHAISEQHIARSGELSSQSVLALGTDPQLSLLLAVEAAGVQRTPAALDALRRALPANHLVRSLSPPGGSALRPLNSAQWSLDGRRVLTASLDGHAYVYDASSGRVLRTFPLSTYYTQGATFDGGGHKVLAWTEGGAAIWSVDGSAPPVRIQDTTTQPIENAVISPNGDFVAVNDHFLADSLFDARTGRLLHTLERSANVDGAMAFSPDSSMVAIGDDGGTASVFDVSTGRLLRKLIAGPRDQAPAVAFSPDGRRLLTTIGLPAFDTSTAFEQTQVWNLANWRQLSYVNGADGGFSPGSGYVATTSSDGTARIWRADTGRLVSQLKSTSHVTSQAQFAADANGDITHVVTGTSSGFATVWNAIAGTQVATLAGDSGSVIPAGFSPDGSQVLTSSSDGYARIWDDGVVAPQSQTAPAAIRAAAAGGTTLGNGFRLATNPLAPVRAYGLGNAPPAFLGPPNSLVVIDARSGAILARLPGSPNVYYDSDAFDGSGRVMLVASSRTGANQLAQLNAELRLVHGGRLLHTLSGPASLASGAAMSPNGRLAATIDAQNRIGVWEVASGRGLTVFRGHVGRSNPYSQANLVVKFSPDGTLVLSSDDSGLTFIWNARTGHVLNRIAGTPVPPGMYSGWGGAISPDDRYAVTVASWDPLGHVYKVGDRHEVAQLRGSATFGVQDATFSPDGTLIAGLASDATRVWDLQHADPVLTLTGLFGDRVEFSHNGETLVTNGSASATSGPTETLSCIVCGGFNHLLALAHQRVTRALTREERALYLGR
jgi:WD40 repeat protein